MKSDKPLYRIISTLFGFIGAFNSIILGFYLISTNLALSSLLEEDLQFQGYLGSCFAISCTLLLTYGTYMLWKGRTYRGGAMNLGAGTILYSIYIYFAFLIKHQILNWLGHAGLFLFMPPILSGLMGITSRKTRISSQS